MKWGLRLDNLSLGGFAPNYWETEYGAYGNNNMGISMTNTDLTNPTFLTQGRRLATIDTVSDLIRGIHPTVIQGDKTYGIGQDGIYSILSTATSLVATVSSVTGEDVALYAGHAKFSYGTDIVDYDLATTWDKDWWTVVAGGSALTSGKPHPMEVAGTSGVLWIANGRYIAEWDGTTATDDAFDTKDTSSEIVSHKWNQNRLWIAANKPNVSGRKDGSIYLWDGNSPSWEYQIKIRGEIGTLWVKNGITYVWYKKNLSDSVSTLGYADGTQIKDLVNYYGSLPKYYQVSEYKDFILWAAGSDKKLFGYGSGDPNLPPRLFQLSKAGTGGIANPFGTPIIATSSEVVKFSGYETQSDWKSIQYDISGDGKESMIDEIRFNIEKMATGARMDYVLQNNAGIFKFASAISYANNRTATHIKHTPRCKTDNFRLELNWYNGSATNPVKVKSIKIRGHTLK